MEHSSIGSSQNPPVPCYQKHIAVLTDPVQAGIMAVRDAAKFIVARLKQRVF